MQKNTFEIVSPSSNHQKIGRVNCFLFNPEGIPRITIGPHWPAMLSTSILLLIVFFIFVFDVCPNVSNINLIIGIILFSAELILYLICSLANPGMIVPSSQMKSTANFNYALDKICTDCNLVKEDYTEHCKKCRVCVEEFDDHYCLLGKCVGKKTIKYFYALIICTFMLLIFTITTAFFRMKKAFS